MLGATCLQGGLTLMAVGAVAAMFKGAFDFVAADVIEVSDQDGGVHALLALRKRAQQAT